MRKFLVLVVLAFAVSALAEGTNVTNVPEMFRGRYYLSKGSEDKGKTWKDMTPGMWMDIDEMTLKASLKGYDGVITNIVTYVEGDGSSAIAFRCTSFNPNYFWMIRCAYFDQTLMMVTVYEYKGKGEPVEKNRTVCYIQR